MKKTIFCLSAISIILASCSVSKQLDRYAHKGILNDTSFANAFTGISIYEPSTGKYWYNHQADKLFVPASNTKIVSCFAAMKYLGDSIAGIRYLIKNDSTVAIQATGDPTFLHRDYSQQPVFDFLKQFKTVQVNRPEFTRYLGTGWAWGDYLQEYMAQRSALPLYGNVARITWKDENNVTMHPPSFEMNTLLGEKVPNGFNVRKPWDKNDFTLVPGREKMMEVPFTPDDETMLQLLRDTLKINVQIIDAESRYSNVIYSRHTDDFLTPMMHRSDNFFAEQSLLMVGDALSGSINDRRAIDTLFKSVYSSLAHKPRWADGSGLSRYNNFSPKNFIEILDQMKNEISMERIQQVFPTGGEGTITSYYIADSGKIYAKTGTLNKVVALSGFLTTKKNKSLIFSVLVNHHNDSATNIRKGIEKFVKNLIAEY